MKKIDYSKISRIIIIIMILLIITGCDFLLKLDQSKEIGKISSNIIYDGEYVIFCKQYLQNDEPGYYTLGEAMYCVELSTGEIYSKLIEFDDGAYLMEGDADAAYLSKTNNNVYLSSTYLRPPWRFSLNDKTWSKIEDSIVSNAFILDYSPNENELVYVGGYGCIYYFDKTINEGKQYTASTNYDMPITVNWNKEIVVYINSKDLDFIDLNTDSTWRIDLSEITYYPINNGIKWFGNNILIDYFIETEML